MTQLDQQQTNQPIQSSQELGQIEIPAAPQQVQPSSGLKTTSGVVSVVFGSLMLLIGLATIVQSVIFGFVILTLGIYGIVSGIVILSSSDTKAANVLKVFASVVVGYAGILLIAGFFIPGFRLSGAILPLVFAIILSVVSNKLGARVR